VTNVYHWKSHWIHQSFVSQLSALRQRCSQTSARSLSVKIGFIEMSQNFFVKLSRSFGTRFRTTETQSLMKAFIICILMQKCSYSCTGRICKCSLVSLFTLSDNGISGVINKTNSNCSPHGLLDHNDDFVIF
jgi:hypothetical protein